MADCGTMCGTYPRCQCGAGNPKWPCGLKLSDDKRQISCKQCQTTGPTQLRGIPVCQRNARLMRSDLRVDSFDDSSTGLNPWHPMTDPVDLKHLGKFGEELGECSAAVSRCIIQGIDEAEPVTHKVNREWLEDEIADVLANIKLVSKRFGLNVERIDERSQRKEAQLRTWHGMA